MTIKTGEEVSSAIVDMLNDNEVDPLEALEGLLNVTINLCLMADNPLDTAEQITDNLKNSVVLGVLNNMAEQMEEKLSPEGEITLTDTVVNFTKH